MAWDMGARVRRRCKWDHESSLKEAERGRGVSTHRENKVSKVMIGVRTTIRKYSSSKYQTSKKDRKVNAKL